MTTQKVNQELSRSHGFSKVSPAVLQPPSAAAVIAANALGDEGRERVNGTLEKP